jgi:lysozyme
VSGKFSSIFFVHLRLQSISLRIAPLALAASCFAPNLPALAAYGPSESRSGRAPALQVAQAQVAQFSLPRFQMPGFPAVPRVFAITPERRALLNTIRYAEGTWKEGTDVGYRVMFGGGLMDSLDRHPDRVNYTPGYASAAAGAYQFMPGTWSLIVRALGIAGFSPQAQDQAALFLIQKRGALSLADSGQLSAELAARLAPEWASFPTIKGSSYYGQPVKRLSELQRFYEANLARLRVLPMAKTSPVTDNSPVCQENTLECALNSIDRR